ncbi:MAG: TonB family protein [Pyrinomonadaceae bacterium]|nr:TonB family protein [Pyrinomonadaceae bacterium]
MYKAREVTRRAGLVLRPQPSYTEDARQKKIEGKVVLRAVLSSSGNVMNITTVEELPGGLTEKAIQAARYIRCIPAMKDGQFVSQYLRLESEVWTHFIK